MDTEQSFIQPPEIKPIYGDRNGIALNPSSTEIDMTNYKLPTIVDVAVTIKFIENRSETGTEDGNRKLYTFTPQT